MVFVSYSTSDRSIADGLVDIARTDGNEVWYDRESLSVGADWGSEIDAAVGLASLVIVVWSLHANRSRQVRHEVDLALAADRRVVLLRVDRTRVPARWQPRITVGDIRSDPLSLEVLAAVWGRIDTFGAEPITTRRVVPDYVSSYVRFHGLLGHARRSVAIAVFAMLLLSLGAGRSTLAWWVGAWFGLAVVNLVVHGQVLRRRCGRFDLLLHSVRWLHVGFIGVTCWLVATRSGRLWALVPFELALYLAAAWLLGHAVLVSFLTWIGMSRAASSVQRLSSMGVAAIRASWRSVTSRVARIVAWARAMRNRLLWGWTLASFDGGSTIDRERTLEWLPGHVSRRRHLRSIRRRRQRDAEVSTASSSEVSVDRTILTGLADVGLAVDMAKATQQRVRLRLISRSHHLQDPESTVVLLSRHSRLSTRQIRALDRADLTFINVGGRAVPPALATRNHISADRFDIEQIARQVRDRVRDPSADHREEWLGISHTVRASVASWLAVLAPVFGTRHLIPLVHYRWWLLGWLVMGWAFATRRCGPAWLALGSFTALMPITVLLARNSSAFMTWFDTQSSNLGGALAAGLAGMGGALYAGFSDMTFVQRTARDLARGDDVVLDPGTTPSLARSVAWGARGITGAVWLVFPVVGALWSSRQGVLERQDEIAARFPPVVGSLADALQAMAWLAGGIAVLVVLHRLWKRRRRAQIQG